MVWVQSEKPADAATGSVVAINVHGADDPDLLRETQLGVRDVDYVGLVWWTPLGFGRFQERKGKSLPKRLRRTCTLKGLYDHYRVSGQDQRVGRL